jgi:hypothetical protein
VQIKDLGPTNSQKRGDFSQKRGDFSQKRGDFFSLSGNYSPFPASLMIKRRREAGLPVWLNLTGLAVYSSLSAAFVTDRPNQPRPQLRTRLDLFAYQSVLSIPFSAQSITGAFDRPSTGKCRVEGENSMAGNCARLSDTSRRRDDDLLRRVDDLPSLCRLLHVVSIADSLIRLDGRIF